MSGHEGQYRYGLRGGVLLDHVAAWRVVDARHLQINAPGGFDMPTAIRIGAAILPAVMRVDAFADGRPDATYVKGADDVWRQTITLP
jgi:hypothetical protein